MDLDALVAKRNEVMEARREIFRRIKTLKDQADTHPLLSYKPTRPEDCKWGDSQLNFHLSLSKVRCLFGGNQSGKTNCTGAEVAMVASGEYPDWYPRAGRLLDGETRERPLTITCFGTNFLESINRVIWPKIRHYLPRDLRVEPAPNSQGGSATVFLPNKCIIHFGTYGQQDQAIAGTTDDFYLFDEPPDSENHFIEIVRGSMARKARIVLSMTDTSISDWSERTLIADATKDLNERYKPYVVFPDIRDNPYIDEKEKQWWIDMLPPDQRDTRLTGRPRALGAAVYGDSFDRDVHVVPAFDLPIKEKLPFRWCLAHSVDPHDSRPPAMGWIAIFDPALGGGLSKIFMVAEDVTSRRIKDSVEQSIAMEQMLGAKAVQRTMDPRFGAKEMALTGKTVKYEWERASREAKYNMIFRLPPGDSLDYGHGLVAKLFRNVMPDGEWKGQPQLQIFDRCPKTISSLRFYKHKIDKKTKRILEPVIDDENKDMCDVIRYFAAARFHYISSEEDAPTTRLTTMERLAAEEEQGQAMISPFFFDE